MLEKDVCLFDILRIADYFFCQDVQVSLSEYSAFKSLFITCSNRAIFQCSDNQIEYSWENSPFTHNLDFEFKYIDLYKQQKKHIQSYESAFRDSFMRHRDILFYRELKYIPDFFKITLKELREYFNFVALANIAPVKQIIIGREHKNGVDTPYRLIFVFENVYLHLVVQLDGLAHFGSQFALISDLATLMQFTLENVK